MAKSMQSTNISRFTDLCNEPVDHLLSPLKGYQNEPLVTLTEAIQPISSFFNEIEDYVYVAVHNCQYPADGLTQQEAASIYLYTMQFDGESSLYVLLNQSLRAEKREILRPWFSFLKLFLTALYRLPSHSGIVWRGVRGVDLSSKYKIGTKFAWWGVSSCTTHVEILESDQFLGKHGQRTLFSIECVNGKSIAKHSHYKSTEKEIILMPGSYFEVMSQLNPSAELHIIQLKEITPPIVLVKPPLSKPNEPKSSSAIHRSNKSSLPESTMTTQMTLPQRLPKNMTTKIANRLLCGKCGKFIIDSAYHTEDSKPCCNECYDARFAPKCTECRRPISNERYKSYRGKNYHSNCFRCGQCDKIIADSEFYVENSKPCCNECYHARFAPKCTECRRPISNERYKSYCGKKYHPGCFRCTQCSKVMSDVEFPAHNSNPYCIQCYDKYVAVRCAKCLQAISVGRSIVYDGREYHPDCFCCGQCGKVMDEIQFQTHNSKPCCAQCYKEHFARRCSRCLKPIIGTYSIFQGKQFHAHCFVCAKCHHIINAGDEFRETQLGILCLRCAH
ncbi:unnamed protein product [Rotaria magnacalcarata]|uniref:NAD(P)(+)--arginine ADP-ribosyltransferase n=1 Tax=Rotaria magnacalcarata TaxID=392030 RepID=A0A816ND54_9BILA|nr:unnamed protein product [Rotaria magnacalcarata]CAF2080267.1 unnamed protein product [Rotaria magnacalcarata]CAF3827786.1 unnamed protein product [Rotaria magnacalcarata]CAF3885242.1 unnamed protein product [Rotaria magnacalcarata]